MRPGTRSTGFGSPRQRGGEPRVDDDELARGAPRARRGSIVSSVRSRGSNVGRLDRLVARGERPAPGVEVDHGAGVVAEVAQQPPEPLGAAQRAVGDDEDVRRRCPRAPAARGEVARPRQRMPARRAPGGAERSRSTSRNDRARDVARRGSARRPQPGSSERPAAVDELVAHRASVTNGAAAAYFIRIDGHEKQILPRRPGRGGTRSRGPGRRRAPRGRATATPAPSPTRAHDQGHGLGRGRPRPRRLLVRGQTPLRRPPRPLSERDAMRAVLAALKPAGAAADLQTHRWASGRGRQTTAISTATPPGSCVRRDAPRRRRRAGRRGHGGGRELLSGPLADGRHGSLYARGARQRAVADARARHRRWRRGEADARPGRQVVERERSGRCRSTTRRSAPRTRAPVEPGAGRADA